MMIERIKKWFKNYWYYYRLHFFAGAFALVLIIITIRGCMTRVTPDLTILLVTSGARISRDSVDALSAELSTHVEDIDGDGKKIVEILAIDLDSGDVEYDIAMSQRFTLEIAAGESKLYLYDDSVKEMLESYDMFEELQPPTLPENVKTAIVSESPIIKGNGIEVSPLSAGVRVLGTGEGKKRQIAERDNAIAVMEALINREE